MTVIPMPSAQTLRLVAKLRLLSPEAQDRMVTLIEVLDRLETVATPEEHERVYAFMRELCARTPQTRATLLADIDAMIAYVEAILARYDE